MKLPIPHSKTLHSPSPSTFERSPSPSRRKDMKHPPLTRSPQLPRSQSEQNHKTFHITRKSPAPYENVVPSQWTLADKIDSVNQKITEVNTKVEALDHENAWLKLEQIRLKQDIKRLQSENSLQNDTITELHERLSALLRSGRSTPSSPTSPTSPSSA